MAKNLPKEIAPEHKVDVSVLKRRKSIEEHHTKTVHNAIKRQETLLDHKVWRQTTVGTKRQRLRSPKEYFVNSLRKEHVARRMNMRLKHIEEAELKAPATGEPLFVVLMRNHLELPRLGQEILAKYRLSKMYEGVVLAGSPAVARDMHVLGDFVSVQSMQNEELFDMVRQKGRYRSNATEIKPLNDNTAIEKHLGQIGVICIEDIIEVLRKGAACPIFEEVARFLEPFNLAPPKSETRARKESKYLVQAAASAKSIAKHLDAKHTV